ncbi:MAG: LacI family DNA-binding transcriptional regulator [Terriglobia bacterium]
MAKNRVRLEDVARSAGVSLTTAWRVLNRAGRVSPEMADAVRKAAEQLQMDLHRKSGTKLIAFLLGNRNLLHPFQSRILAGVESYCTHRDYNVIFLSLHYALDMPWKEIAVPKILRRRDFVDGFILAGPHGQNLLDLLAHSELPIAVQANNIVGSWRDEEYDTVWFDDVDGEYRLAAHLISQGHRDIWFAGNRRLPWFESGYVGYARAMSEAGLTPRSAGLDLEQPREVGYLAVKSILAQSQPVSAILAGSDATAQGVYDALRDSGISVPDEMSVAGFDDIEASALHPRLTTSHIFLEAIGRQLAEFLLRRIEQPGLAPQKSVIPTRLVKGESTAPPSPRQGEVKSAAASAEPGVPLPGELSQE